MSSIDDKITPVQPQVWRGRIDSVSDTSQFRLHQVVSLNTQFDHIKEDHVVVLGFASDEGVRRNKGRTGAVDGPNYFRGAIGSLCYHGKKSGFSDLGNIEVDKQDLESAQLNLSNTVEKVLAKQGRPFVIGGGHETAFGHFLGIVNFLKNRGEDFKLGILNIDAHLDMRSYEQGAHSGSWALQAFEKWNNENHALGYYAYGLNEDNNTRYLLDVARANGADWSTNEEVLTQEGKEIERVQKFINAHTHIYCTVCLDVFDAAIAPGVSAPAWNGINLQAALSVIDLAKESGKLFSLDICELNPSYDKNGQTAKTAGSIFNRYLK